jgi:Na+(H+)/acetate symporter ActP
MALGFLFIIFPLISILISFFVVLGGKKVIIWLGVLIIILFVLSIAISAVKEYKKEKIDIENDISFLKDLNKAVNKVLG